MAAIVCPAPEDYRLEEARLPRPGVGDALLRIYGVGICASDLFHKDWTVISSFAACHTFQPTIAWLTNGVIDVDPLVSDAVPMDSFEEAFQRFAHDEALKGHEQAKTG